MKRKSICLILTTALMLTACSTPAQDPETSASASEGTAAVTETSEESAESTETSAAETTQREYPDVPEGVTVPEGYRYIWGDEFDGDELGPDWFREPHSAGWVNHELQAYTVDEEYSYVEDGLLIIQPAKIVDEDGDVSYRSGRLSTYGHFDFTYGRVEASIRTPEGVGFLPAFWMLPSRGTYGNWPVSGEIDIMEVVGGSEDTTHGTIHYGNPHAQNQGSYTLPEGEFSDGFHVYACEWEPGHIAFYVDDILFYETSYWYSSSSGGNERAYPAPFNLPFYIILNVAVGGDWPGDPDEDTPFDERAQMRVDYVRVFQREEYDEDVTRPERELSFREPDETGNYISDDAWNFFALEGGEGTCVTENGTSTITVTDPGTVDYSIQLVNEGVPMEQGRTYRVSFDASSDEDAAFCTAVTGPDIGYVRYMEDQVFLTGTAPISFEYTFTMEENSDDNARLEFNLGTNEGVGTITISNVRIEAVEE